MSMTNYADVVDEKSNASGGIPSIISNFPIKIKAHPFLEKPTKKPKNEGGKGPVRPLLDIRNSRLDEISRLGFAAELGHGAHGKLASHDPSRTL